MRRSVSLILLVTLVITLYCRIQFLTNCKIFHRIWMRKFSPTGVRLSEIYIIKTSISWYLVNLTLIICEISLTLSSIYNQQKYISETKIDFIFASTKLHLSSYTIPCRLKRIANNCGILLYLRESIPLTLLISDLSIKGFFVRTKLRKNNGSFVAFTVLTKT